MGIFLEPSVVDFRTFSVVEGKFWCWMIISTAAIIFYNNLFKKIVSKDTYVVYIGRNSIIYYTLHWILIILAKTIIDVLNINMPIIQFLFILMFSFSLLHLFSKSIVNSNVKRCFGL